MPDQIKVKPPWTALDAEPTPDTVPGASSGLMIEPAYHQAYTNYVGAKTPENAGALLKAVQPVLSEAVRSYGGGEAASPTTISRAKSLALEAFGRYDPARAKLRTHLLSHLRGLRRQVSRSASGVYIPEQHRIDSMRLSAAIPDLTDRLGREPSAAEIADHTGLGLDRVRRARAVPGVLASSQAGDAMTSDKRDSEAWKTWTEAIYLDSSPTDQVILDHSFNLHGQPELTGTEIAKKLGLSPGAISQRRAKLQQQLDQYETFMGSTPR